MSGSESLRIDAEHPWPWLDAFPESAQGFFNGRDEATAQLLRCVLAAPATVLFGKSGLGKTSLLQAGLFPLLRTAERRLLPVLVRLDHGVDRPGLSAQLLARLKAETQAHQIAWEHPALPDEDTLGDTARLWELLHDSRTQWRDAEGRRWTPVFVLDQFEEVFTLVAEVETQQRLFDELGNLVQGRIPAEVAARLDAHDELLDRIDPERLGARFVLSLREDYLPDLEIHADRIPRLGPNRYRLLAMSRTEGLEAIGKTGGELIDEIDSERIVDFLTQQNHSNYDQKKYKKTVEPALLSLVCAGLNDIRLKKYPAAIKIETKALATLGNRLLEKFYDEALDATPEKTRQRLRIFIESELITPDGTRRPFPESALKNIGLNSSEFVILKNKRLLRTENTERGPHIELVHDRIAVVAARRAKIRADAINHQNDIREQRNKKRIQTALAISIAAIIGLLAFFWQWKEAKTALARASAALHDSTAQRLLTEGENILNGQREGGALRGLLTVMAGKKLSETASHRTNLSGLGSLQKQFSQQKNLNWVKEVDPTTTIISISHDGTYIATAIKDNNINIWDTLSRKLVRTISTAHSGKISAIAISPDKKMIVSGGSDKTLRLWEIESLTMIGTPITGHSESISSLSFSPDGKIIASGSSDKTIRLWDTQSKSFYGYSLNGHSATIRSIAFSPDGSQIASASDDKTVRIWSSKYGSQIGQPLRGHSAAVLCVAFSPNGLKIVTTSSDTSIRLWDTKSGSQINDPLLGHSDSVLIAAFSPDGSQIGSGSSDNTIRFWDVTTGTTIGEPLSGHSDAISSIAFRPDGSHLISGSADKTIRIWNINKTTSREILSGHSDSVSSVAFNSDGSRIISGSADHTLRLWDTSNGSLIKEPFKGHTDSVSSVVFSPDGKLILSGSTDNTIRFWGAISGKSIDDFIAHSSSVRSVAFSPDGSKIVAGSTDKNLRIREKISGAPIGNPIKGHTDSIWSVAFSPDGSKIISGSADKTVRLWDTHKGLPIGKPFTGHTASVLSVTLSPDGKRAASSSADKTIIIWDITTGLKIGEPLKGHTGSVWSVAFSPDGARLASGSSDKTIRLWDTYSGEPIGTPLRGHTDSVWSIAFSPDGNSLASGSGDNTIRIWKIFDAWQHSICSKLSRNLTHEEWKKWISPDIDYVVQCPGLPVPAD